jgi:endonuclease-3 related protein
VAVHDLPEDPGLVQTTLRTAHGPRVGTPLDLPLERFATEPALDRILLELHRGHGPQEWWPARTPFEVLVGAVLTQNTAWRNVELALAELAAVTEATPARLLALPARTLEAAIRPAGFYRAKARTLVALSTWYLGTGGLRALRERPLEDVRGDLLALRGIGPETADSILCYAAGRRAVVVDAYARRVLERHGLLAPGLSYEEVRGWLSERLVPSQAIHEEFHALCVRAGKDHCRRAPDCASCPATAPDESC